MIIEILTGSGGGFCPICKMYWGGFCPRQQKRVGGDSVRGGGFCPTLVHNTCTLLSVDIQICARTPLIWRIGSRQTLRVS